MPNSNDSTDKPKPAKEPPKAPPKPPKERIVIPSIILETRNDTRLILNKENKTKSDK